MHSMTGFGQGEARGDGVLLTLKLSAYNRRGLELRFSLPTELAACEPALRQVLQERLSRGSVQVTGDLRLATDSGQAPLLDHAVAAVCCRELRALKAQLGLAGEVTLTELLAIPELRRGLQPDLPPEALAALAQQALETALAGLLAMRAVEGATLAKDLRARAATLRELAARIAALAPRVPALYREKLRLRLQELAGDVKVDEQRLAQELVMFADRCDVAEELTRLRSHLDQLDPLLAAAVPIGRKLDFLIQELNREINTVGSKANDQEITMVVVDFKTELERLREQAQNIE